MHRIMSKIQETIPDTMVRKVGIYVNICTWSKVRCEQVGGLYGWVVRRYEINCAPIIRIIC